MKALVLRRFVHRGSALAAGLFVDTEALGEQAAERRLLRMAAKGAAVYRSGTCLVLRFAEPQRMLAEQSPGGLLVQYGECLSSAPLEKDEIARLDIAGPTVVLVRCGAVELFSLDGAKPEDPASWIDVSDFEVASEIESLGRPAPAPRPQVAAVRVDVREALGAPPRPPGEAEILAALREAASSGSSGERALLAGSGAGAPGWASALGRFFAGIAQVLGSLFGQSRGAPAGAGAASGAGQSLAVREREPPAESGWLSSLARGLRSLSLRLLILSRMAHLVGRRQAEYLSRMLEMFDRGDLDSALRHAISLGNDGEEGGPVDPALGTPSPRKELAIGLRRRRGGPAILSGPLLYAELRRRYRRAFEILAAAGQIEKAAFVLAELLGAYEEAVSFLEKHGRYRLAAEIAEARDLAPGLVVRQWWLADRARAVRLARSKGVFADAIHRLEVSGKTEEAAMLRLIWAETLAASGSFAAAASAVWPVGGGRNLAAVWLDRAIEMGGPAGARMAVRKARLFPERFGEARDRLTVFLREPGEDGLVHARNAGAEIVAAANSAAERALSRSVVRALLRSEEQEDADLAVKLLAVSKDHVLRADVELLLKKPAPAGRQGASVSAAAVTNVGKSHLRNEDVSLAVLLSRHGKVDTAELAVGDTAVDGVVIGAFDGLGGNMPGHSASELARDVVAEHLRRAFSGWSGEEAPWGEALREAVEAASKAIYKAGATDFKMRGCGSTVAVASAIGSALFVAHAGDCRAYLWRGGEVTLLTRDHSLLNEPSALERLSPDELAVHENVITRALGVSDKIEVDVTIAPLSGGDVALVCSDGAWRVLKEEDLKEVLSSGQPPEKMCRALMMRCLAAETPDNVAIAVARFEGLPAGREVSFAAVPRQERRLAAPVITKTIKSSLLCHRSEPALVQRAAADTGAIAIVDAAELPDGRVLVALGELGARLISREGKTLARFSEPAHEIVISDHGDRALLVAKRGEAMRVARVDLVGRRQQAWCDVALSAFASDFDGSVWYVAREDTLYAIDATSTGWEHLWHVKVDLGGLVEVARNEEHVSARYVDYSPAIQTESGATAPRLEVNEEIWVWDLPSHTLRGKHRIRPKDSPRQAALSATGRLAASDERGAVRVFEKGTWRHAKNAHPGDPSLRLTDDWLLVGRAVEEKQVIELFDMRSLTPRARVELEGAGRAAARFGRDRLLVFDDRGRLLVISLRSGSVLYEMRLS